MKPGTKDESGLPLVVVIARRLERGLGDGGKAEAYVGYAIRPS